MLSDTRSWPDGWRGGGAKICDSLRRHILLDYNVVCRSCYFQSFTVVVHCAISILWVPRGGTTQNWGTLFFHFVSPNFKSVSAQVPVTVMGPILPYVSSNY